VSRRKVQILQAKSGAVREGSEVWQALNKSVKTRGMLELNKSPVFKTVINEIFTQ